VFDHAARRHAVGQRVALGQQTQSLTTPLARADDVVADFPVILDLWLDDQ
jgi:hypothetical protein